MESYYTKILEKLAEDVGFEYKAYKTSMLEKRIDNRITFSNAEDPRSYLKLMDILPDEKNKLIDNFHINVSQFFRDPIIFEFIYKYLMPLLINKDKSLRIWSAGCASGQEPYSMAILIKEYLEQENFDCNIDFFATDSDKGTLEKARMGLYTKKDLNECKLRYVEKHFTNDDQGYYISDDIKNMIHFSVDNLLDKNNYAPKESIFGGFDLVFCRNVMIYFREKNQKQVLEKLYKSLNKGGYLILGESEIIPQKYISKFTLIDNYCKIYRRIN